MAAAYLYVCGLFVTDHVRYTVITNIDKRICTFIGTEGFLFHRELCSFKADVPKACFVYVERTVNVEDVQLSVKK